MEIRQHNGFKATIFDSIIKIINFFYVQVSQFEDKLASASLVVLDGNIPVSTIDYVCSISKNHAVPGKALLSNTDSECCRHSFKSVMCISLSFSFAAVWFEPTDADKACKPFLSESWKALSYTSPNLAELCTMNHTLGLPTPTGNVVSNNLKILDRKLQSYLNSNQGIILFQSCPDRLRMYWAVCRLSAAPCWSIYIVWWSL